MSTIRSCGRSASDWFGTFVAFVDDLVQALRAAREVREVVLRKVGVQWTGQRLAAGNESASSSAAVAVVSLFPLLFLHVCLDNLLHVTNLDKDVLWLQICVDDTAFAVEVIKTEKDLLCDLLDERHGDTAVVPALDQAEQVLAEYLEHHAYVHAVRSLVVKRVQQAHDMCPTRVVLVGFHNLIEKLDLIERSLGVVSGRTDNLERNVLAGNVVL